MYVCMHACMHACMYVCMYVCMCAYTYTYMHNFVSFFAEGGSKNGPKQAIDLLVLMDDASLPADRVVCSAACLRSIGFRDSGLKG